MGTIARLVPAALAAVTVTVTAVGCNAGELRQSEGQRLATEYGCLACHGDQGQGASAPSWIGLYGSTIELQDGTTVTVDRDYLRRAIRDPAAQVPKGVTIVMPANPQVTDADMETIIDWIVSLGSPSS